MVEGTTGRDYRFNSLELAQQVFPRGLFEWDDTIHNSIGCIVGYMLNEVVRKFINRKDRL